MTTPLPGHLKAYLAAAPVCRIATVRADGDAHAIPVCPVFDGDATVYVDLAPKSVTARGILLRPRVTVLIDDYNDDWSKLRKVILRCDALEVDGAERDTAWQLIRAKFPQHEGIGWTPRLTVALRITAWMAEGFPGGKQSG
jgi:nitroimidazol reductase NimA-like FMN-containing flavoprotein (pyridoxamine 5'-phosphate oxidase superfamily)